MACGLQSRCPCIDLQKLWREFGIINENLSECVKNAEAYFLNLDAKVSSTKEYFAEIKSRISSISKGDVVVTSDLDRLLQMGEPEVHQYFLSLRSVAQEGFVRDSEERRAWMRETNRLMEKQRAIIGALESRVVFQDGEISRLRGRVEKTFENIAFVEGEVKGLQKVLYDCEVGRTELEEDFILLVKSYKELEKTIEQSKLMETLSEPKEL